MTITINNKNKKTNVPNLRFPEFQGEWEKKSLGEIGDSFIGLTYKPTDVVSEGGLIVFRSSNIQNGCMDYKDIVRVNKNVKEKLITKKDDLLVCARNGSARLIGKNAILHEADANQTFGAFMMVFRSDKNHFVHQLLNTRRYTSQVSENLGARINQITSSDLSSFEFFFPTENSEMNKIAALLDLLDERIVTQSKIIDKLQTLIKGIVDSTILRKEKNAIVGDVCSISEQIRAEANIDDIITVRLHGNGVCKSSAENLQLGATQYYRRRAGQLIYGKQNFHNGAIGIVPISLDNGITSKDIPSFDIDEMKCNSVYLLAQLQSPQYYKPAEALTTGTGSKRLKEETFLKMPIVLPNKREQDNIATLIISISANLDQAKKMLDLFSIQKQYLLRQMFI